MNFLENDKFHRATEVLSCNVQDGTVLLDIGEGLYFGLDAVGSVIWSELEQERNLAQLLSAISKQFECEAESIKPDIILFLDQMLDRKLLLIS